MAEFIELPSGKRICRMHHKIDCIDCIPHTIIADGDIISNSDSINHVSGGRVGSVLYYNPHNSRFYFSFDKWNFKPSSDFRIINSSELCLDSFDGCRFVVKKSMVEVTNKVDSLRAFPIRGSVSEREGAVRDAVNVLRSEAISALKHFISCFGGASDFVVVREWIADHKISHHPIFDGVVGATWRDDFSKKVYPLEAHVEASSTVSAVNVVRNLAIHDVSAELESRLDKIDSDLLIFRRDALEPLTAQIRLHLDVMNNMNITLMAIRDAQKFPPLLSSGAEGSASISPKHMFSLDSFADLSSRSQAYKDKLSLFLFKRFGVKS